MADEFVEAARKQQKRRNNARRLWLIVPVSLVFVAWLFTYGNDAPPSEDLATTPGYSPKERTISTAPFEAAGATERGATTIPGDIRERSTSTVPTTTTPPSTIPALPSAGDDLVCGAMVNVAEVLRLSPTDGGVAPVPTGLGDRMRDAANKVEQTNDPAYAPVVLTARAVAKDLDGATSVDQVRTALAPLTAPSNPAVGNAMQAMYAHATQACPGITGAIG
ncbi:MAG: hypothetical protein ACTHN0_04355 [Aquihabitans sp.]